MGRHAVRARRRPVPWFSVLVLGLVAGGVVAGVLAWGAARPGVVVAGGVLVGIGTAVAVVLGARLPEPEAPLPEPGVSLPEPGATLPEPTGTGAEVAPPTRPLDPGAAAGSTTPDAATDPAGPAPGAPGSGPRGDAVP